MLREIKQYKERLIMRIIKEQNENKKNINIWIDGEVKEQVKAEAKRHGMLFGKYIELLLKKGLEAKKD